MALLLGVDFVIIRRGCHHPPCRNRTAARRREPTLSSQAINKESPPIEQAATLSESESSLAFEPAEEAADGGLAVLLVDHRIVSTRPPAQVL
jgi:hypothetical protein